MTGFGRDDHEDGRRPDDGQGAKLTEALSGITVRPWWASDESLHDNDWVSLRLIYDPGRGVNGYVYSHETRCRGRIVAVLPWRDNGGRREYLVKSEVTPCWGTEFVLSAITGGWEGGDIADDAVRELLEETGYEITRDDLIWLGESYGTKSADTVYSLFTADLTGHPAGAATGDGTQLEAESEAKWVDAATLAALMDPQLAVMHVRLNALDAVFRREAPTVPDPSREAPASREQGSQARVDSTTRRGARDEAVREKVAREIETEAATHLFSIRRAMRWAAWVARGKPENDHPGRDCELKRAAEAHDLAATPCCPVETAAVARAVAAERERIRKLAFDAGVVVTGDDGTRRPFADLIWQENRDA
jgi:8-oxo-dGTP pyrophosphatase MutT (NUDIX family)